MTRLLQLRIELNGIEPEIWRRFRVRDDISFQELHRIIQAVMGWENHHLYEFCVGDETITSGEEDANLAEASFRTLFNSPEFVKMLDDVDLTSSSASLDVNKVNRILQEVEMKKAQLKHDTSPKVSTLLRKEGEEFYYIYDFGDHWEHTITVEKIVDEAETQETCVCLAGKRACPPEDCGSIHGYYELQKIKKNKKHPDYHDLIVEWLGEDFDFELFDLREVNGELKRLSGRMK